MGTTKLSFLETLGWDKSLDAAFAKCEAGSIPARVLEVRRSGLRLGTVTGEINGEIAGRLRKQLEKNEIVICVGDWVVGELSGELFWIKQILPRKGLIARAEAGGTGRNQSLVANCDELWILTCCNQDFSPERIERYAAMGSEGGAQPVVILTKADLSSNKEQIEELARRLVGVPIHLVSSISELGLPELQARLTKGKTIACMGSSGVGKSTLINALLKRNAQDTGETRENDNKGRHTTTARSLIISPEGACLVDTPGLREVALAEGNDLAAFTDIQNLALQCKYTNCSHQSEPSCAVQAALQSGSLTKLRLDNFLKLQKEQAVQDRKSNKTPTASDKKSWKRSSLDGKK